MFPSTAPTVLCGFNWDLRTGIDPDPATAKALTAKLWMGTLKNFGYAGYTMPEQVVDYWIQDDDNGNVDDGVPHQGAITTAATNHGFTDVIWINSKKWSKEVAASELTAGILPNAVAMDLDKYAKPHVAFIKTPENPPEAQQSYVYKRRSGATWGPEETIAETKGGKSIDLALLANGTAVVVYEQTNNQDAAFRYATRTASAWVLEPNPFVTRTSKVPEGVSIDVGANKEVHVVYGTGELDPLFSPNPKIWYAKKLANSWSVDSSPIDGGGAATLDYAAGVIRICYVDVGGQVKYATRVDNATTWTMEVISSSPGGPVTNTALAIDASNNAHVCYSVQNTLWYSKRTGGWSTPEIVDQAVAINMARGLGASIAADAAGYAAISYHDEYTGDLRYARKNATGWTRDDVDRPRDTGEYTVLRLDPAGNPIIAYFQRTDGQVKVAAGAIAKVPNAYQSSVVPQITRGSGMQAEGGDVVPIVRLCPAGDYDQITFQVTLRDVLGAPMNNYLLTLVEEDGSVNVVGGGPTGTTNTSGYGEIALSSASGSGWVGICAGGSIMSSFEVRSPDVSGGGGAPENCSLPTGTSVVDTFDVTNTECGFDAKSGAVLSDVNRWWDLNGDDVVDSEDEDGWLEGSSMVGGVTQHMAHAAVLGAENTCGGSGKMLAGGYESPAPGASPAGEGPATEPNYTGLLASLKREFAIIPNPATGLARLVWSARAGESARAEVYDVSGRRVRSLRFDQAGAGVRLLEWDGKEATGAHASSGVYFVRLTSPRGSLVERFTLVR